MFIRCIPDCGLDILFKVSKIDDNIGSDKQRS